MSSPRYANNLRTFNPNYPSFDPDGGGPVTDTHGRITLWGIEVFLAAAEEGAVSTAARRLGVSPSAVSQQLAGIEAALGVVLIDRSARPMRTTPAGQVFRRHAQTILNAATEARVDLAQTDPAALMTLRLGMIEDFEAEVTPLSLITLCNELPGCRFLLETGASHRLFDQLEARALDLIVTADTGGEGDIAQADFETFPVLHEPFVLAVPGGDHAVDAVETVNSLPFIQYSARHIMGRRIAAHLARENLRFPVRIEADSYHAILAMVAAGAGWTILTPLGLHHASRFRNEVRVLPLPFPAFGRTISLTARRGILHDLPEQVTRILRALLQDQVVAPMTSEWPWLSSDLRVLQDIRLP
jgi:DNA-binding transcriptional LysR family regulator